MSNLEKQIADRIAKLPNNELIEMLEAPREIYTPFALEIAQRELDKRGGKSLILEQLTKCEGEILRQNRNYTSLTQDYAKRQKWHWVWYIIFSLLLLSTISGILNNYKQPSFEQPAQPVQPLPLTGVVNQYVFVIMGTSQSPLKIITRESKYHYFVKLVDWAKGSTVLTLFIRSGHSVSINVPLGSYKMKYATGKQWYGESFLFGPETLYNEADKKFDFEWCGNQVSGYTVELYLQPQGNLRTKKISAEQF